MSKSVSIIVGIILAIANILLTRVLITGINDEVCIISTAVIVFASIFCLIIKLVPIADGFKISLPYLVTFLGIIEYGLSFFICPPLEDEVCFIVIVVLALIEIAIFAAVCCFSNRD